MQVFAFDWTAYGENVDKFRENGEMPRLGKKHFDPNVAFNTYKNHVEAWKELEKQGFDGVAINEHHGTPFGLGNSPNLMAAALSQVTDRLKILIYANLLPIHEPLRLKNWLCSIA
jgi:alkanesulfonate monooxygenase SsuD/methylene tetrahydromethanopterin reductase-like flavin-dependent oxidoreductase (luciferase family)